MGNVLANQVEHVGVDVIGARGVEEHVPAARDLAQRALQGGPVEEADLAGELDAQYVAAEVLFDDAPQRPAQRPPGSGMTP